MKNPRTSLPRQLAADATDRSLAPLPDGTPDLFVLRVFEAPENPNPLTPVTSELEYVNGGSTHRPRNLSEAMTVVSELIGTAEPDSPDPVSPQTTPSRPKPTRRSSSA